MNAVKRGNNSSLVLDDVEKENCLNKEYNNIMQEGFDLLQILLEVSSSIIFEKDLI